MKIIYLESTVLLLKDLHGQQFIVDLILRGTPKENKEKVRYLLMK